MTHTGTDTGTHTGTKGHVTTVDTDAWFRPGRWQAKWIWADYAPRRRHVVALRRDVQLHEVPSVVPARMFAVARYTLWVNGTEVSWGPTRSNPRRGYYDVVDLAPLLRVGSNALAARVVLYDRPNPWFLPGPGFNDIDHGAFLFEALVAGVDGEPLVSDRTWSATVIDGWTSTSGHGVSGRGVEQLAAEALDDDWTRQPVSWASAIERRATALGESGIGRAPSYTYGPHAPRPFTIAPPLDRPLRSVAADEWVLDQVEVGTLVIDVEGPPGATIEMRTGEFTDAEGRLVADDKHDVALAITTDGERHTLETIDRYGLRALRATVPEGCALHSIAVRDRNFPVRGDGSFRSSDPLLDKVFAVGRRTVTLNSYDAYTDCPTREQRAWTGDSVVHQMVDLTTNDDWSLARWHPVLTASPRADGMLPMAVGGDVEASDLTVIPDWALHWVRSVHNLYRYTGDRDLVAPMVHVIEGVLRWFDRFDDGTGLPTDVSGWVIIDWASVPNDGNSASLIGLLARAYVDYAEIATWLGHDSLAAWAEQRHARLVAGFERFWDPERARYADVYVDGERGPTASQHTQAAALVGGLAPADRHDRLAELLLDDDRRVWATFSTPDREASPNGDFPVGSEYLSLGTPPPWWDVDHQLVGAQPFFRYVVHDALAVAGRSDVIAARCRDWAMALERCPTSLTETWFGGTVCHGWSATPTRDMITRVLGVQPAEPGFDVASVEPHLGDLEWAEGRAPTPHGPIAVRVDRDEVTIDSPVPVMWRGQRLPAGQHQVAR